MFTGSEIAAEFVQLGITHVVWLPDSTLGPWEQALAESAQLQLIRVCREGEAWAIAGGLYLGGASPIVVMQCTGLFESGDALRNMVHDYQLPLFALIGHRSALLPDSPDTAKTFTEPILQTWQLPYESIRCREDFPRLADHYRTCQESRRAGVVLLAEGRM